MRSMAVVAVCSRHVNKGQMAKNEEVNQVLVGTLLLTAVLAYRALPPPEGGCRCGRFRKISVSLHQVSVVSYHAYAYIYSIFL